MRRIRELTGVEQLEMRIESLTTPGAATHRCRPRDHDDVICRLEERLDESTTRLRLLTAEFEATRRALHAFERRSTFTEWVSSVPLRREPLVTVVLATLGHRPAELHQALASIADQSYGHFEVVVVSPGPVLGDRFIADPRFREARVNMPGVGHARNVGLSHARGVYITYADDDNTMGAQWLRAVVWCFSTESEIDVVYGARLHEHEPGTKFVDPAFWWFEGEWDPALLQQFNPIDTGVLGHRAGMAEAKWDEALVHCDDWDIAIRLTATGRVRPLPVRACTYTTSSSGRITARHSTPAVVSELQRRAREAGRVPARSTA